MPLAQDDDAAGFFRPEMDDVVIIAVETIRA
jgi:hypothetical protein